MSSSSSPDRSQVDAIAGQTGFSTEAVESMYRSIVRGGGGMAQFEHREFGGSGQWMRGGMTMIGDMSNRDLEQRVRRLCDALSVLAASEPADAVAGGYQSQSQFSGGMTSIEESQGPETPRASSQGTYLDDRVDPSTWYPAALGRPDSSGTQNHTRYAWFGGVRRLALGDGHGVTVYDTGDHRIGGVSQQQGGEGSVVFVSQHGEVDVASLPVVDDAGPARAPVPRTDAGEQPEAAASAPARSSEPAAGLAGAMDPFVALEKLSELHRRGVLDDDDHRQKKAELLARI